MIDFSTWDIHFILWTKRNLCCQQFLIKHRSLNTKKRTQFCFIEDLSYSLWIHSKINCIRRCWCRNRGKIGNTTSLCLLLSTLSCPAISEIWNSSWKKFAVIAIDKDLDSALSFESFRNQRQVPELFLYKVDCLKWTG